MNELHGCTTLKGGVRKLTSRLILFVGSDCLIRLNWIIKLDNKTGFICGRRKKGYFLFRDINGNDISKSVSYKKLTLIEKRKGLIMDVIH